MENKSVSSPTILRSAARILGSIIGRTLVSLSRLLVALIIVRMTSPTLYGGYVVLMSLIVVGEWLVDFGFSDISVRELGMSAEQRQPLLASLIIIKGIQATITAVIIFAAARIMALPVDATALLVGLASVVIYAFALIQRSLHRLEMTTHIDVLFEAISLVVMMLAIIISGEKTNLIQLMAFQALARFVYWLCNSIYFARSNVWRVQLARSDLIKNLTLHSLPIGVAGLLVTIYDNMNPIILAKVMSLDSLAIYSVALRFLLPIAIITQAISAIFFTLLAQRWHDREWFLQTQQTFVEVSCLVSGLLFCGIFSSAEFCMSLFGRDLVQHFGILQLASVALFAKAITISMSPPIVIAGKQHKTLILTLWVVLLSAGLVYWIAPQFGLVGVVGLYVFIEVFVTAIPLIFLSQYMAQFSLNWLPIIKLLIASALVIGFMKLAFVHAGFFEGVLAGFLFLGLSYCFGFGSRKWLSRLQYVFHPPTYQVSQ